MAEEMTAEENRRQMKDRFDAVNEAAENRRQQRTDLRDDIPVAKSTQDSTPAISVDEHNGMGDSGS